MTKLEYLEIIKHYIDIIEKCGHRKGYYNVKKSDKLMRWWDNFK